MNTFMLVMSAVLAIASGQLSYWLIWAVANRCRTTTAFAIVAGVALCAATSSMLAIEYVRGGGGWLAFILPWVCYALGLCLFHGLFWFRMEIWTRVEVFFYNLTKKKEAK